jgi:hypothetical protein
MSINAWYRSSKMEFGECSKSTISPSIATWQDQCMISWSFVSALKLAVF